MKFKMNKIDLVCSDDNNLVRFKLLCIAIIIVVSTIVSSQYCLAESDLEDDISKYTDDPISKWDELGKESVNINFIISEAIGRVDITDEEDVIQNSVIVGPGANVGDIYNIHLNGTGTSTTSEDESDDANVE